MYRRTGGAGDEVEGLRVTCSTFCIWDPQILGATEQNMFARETWYPGLVRPSTEILGLRLDFTKRKLFLIAGYIALHTKKVFKKNCSKIAVSPCIFYCFTTRIFR